MNTRVKVLVVDDSALMRRAISELLRSDRDIEVVGVARNGKDALEKIRLLDPDVVTMDVEMPVMDGLEALQHIMCDLPRPVIMISDMSADNAQATVDALATGAMDFIAKNYALFSERNSEVRRQLIRKVKLFGGQRSAFIARRQAGSADTMPLSKGASRQGSSFEELYCSENPQSEGSVGGLPDMIFVGASTGGPGVLQRIIPGLPEGFPAPVVVVQHMPAQFTKSLAERLNCMSALPVYEARNQEALHPGAVYLAPGGMQLRIYQAAGRLHFTVDAGSFDEVYKPSVNYTAQSIAALSLDRVICVMLSGMGKDGLEGFRQLKAQGHDVIVQSKESCVIYGMPKAIVEARLADRIFSPKGIRDYLIYATRSSRQFSPSRRKGLPPAAALTPPC